MRNPLIAATLGLLLLADVAQAHTLVATSNILIRATQRTLDFTSDTTTSIRDSKIGRCRQFRCQQWRHSWRSPGIRLRFTAYPCAGSS